MSSVLSRGPVTLLWVTEKQGKHKSLLPPDLPLHPPSSHQFGGRGSVLSYWKGKSHRALEDLVLQEITDWGFEGMSSTNEPSRLRRPLSEVPWSVARLTD